jgi:LDH2 family malate/lactate/ureidoglycolate dehydrogenase
MAGAARVGEERLETFCAGILTAVGVPAPGARQVADCLVSANLQGVDTHGVARLPTYVRRIRQGAIDARGLPRVVSTNGAVALVDGANALGPLAACFGMDIAMARARELGVAYVGVRNSNHFSYAAYYCERAAAGGMVGLCSSGGEPTVAPWGGIRAFYTNSPIALAAPTSDRPLVVDLATSVSSRGGILLAKLLGKPIPEGWAVDARGRPTTDAAEALLGSVLPMGGAKGYALIVALEVLNSVLTGGAVAPNVGSQSATDGKPAGVSHFFIALDPEALIGRDCFVERMDALVQATRTAEASDAARPVLVPGDRRREVATERRREGIPLPAELRAELLAIARAHAPEVEELL